MANKLVEWCKNLKLSVEETKTIGGVSNVNTASRSNEKFLMVASLLTTRPFNLKALGRTMESVWRPAKGLEYKKLGDNVILFEFRS